MRKMKNIKLEEIAVYMGGATDLMNQFAGIPNEY